MIRPTNYPDDVNPGDYDIPLVRPTCSACNQFGDDNWWHLSGSQMTTPYRSLLGTACLSCVRGASDELGMDPALPLEQGGE